ncbi:MAG: type III pantothenate kinase [Planctomycetota bacterium]
MILAIDIGNSRVHFGCFNKTGVLVASETISHDDLKLAAGRSSAVKRLSSLHKYSISTIVLASTCPKMNRLIIKLVENIFGIKVLEIGKDISVPIANRTDNPSKIGQDRLLNALAAYRRTKTQTIVIDAGTAVTIDVVSAKGGFSGGIIAPGMRVMAQALHQRCEMLPLIKASMVGCPSAVNDKGVLQPRIPSSNSLTFKLLEYNSLHSNSRTIIGKDTESAMASGIFFSVVGLINEAVTRISRPLKSKPKILITGGNAGILRPYIASNCKQITHLTLEGIYLVAAGRQITA